MTTPLHLAIELDGDGAHPAAWRAAAHGPDTLLTPQRVAQTVAAAERAGFTIATFDDSAIAPGSSPDVIGRLDAVQRAAFASQLTSAIGLLPVVDALYTEPFHVSTQLATLDHASLGRGGWIVSTNADVRSAAAYGREPIEGADAVRRETSDVVETNRRLWDSWEDDAVIRDVATGRYLDRDKLHYAEVVTQSFSVIGPSIIPRPPQGQLVVAGDHGAVDSAQLDIALVRGAGVAALRSEAESARASGVPLVFAELEVALDSAGVSAEARLTALDRRTPWPGSQRHRFAGTARELIELLESLSAVVDGVRLHPAVLDVDLVELERAVLPELRRRGLSSAPRVGDTLRRSLGLPHPVNRYAVA